MLGAGVAAAETLEKNLGQTTSASVANLSNRDLSQAFTTGSTADAYELTGVTVQFGTVPGSTATVTAFIADGQGTSDDIIANLTNPPTWTTTSTFTAPDGITLDANTTYHLIIEGTEGTLATTASDSEDSGGVTGWSIADAQTQRSMVSDSGLGGTWTIAINALKISVEGDHKGTVTACNAASMQNQVWGTTLTVGKLIVSSIEFLGWSSFSDYAGASLPDDEFTFASDTYQLSGIYTEGGTLSLGFSPRNLGDIATQTTRDSLVLHVGNDAFNLGDGILQASQTVIIWLSNVPTWGQYDRICVALTEVDTTAPTATGGTIWDTAKHDVVVIFDESLDITSKPVASAFKVTVEGEDRTGINFILTGTAATVGFNPAARPGEEVKLSYTKPETNVLKDLAENEVESFTNLPVTNNLAATAPEAPGNLAATPGTVADTMVLTWDTPWANGDAITKFQVHHVAGSTAGGTWADILNSDADTTTHTVTGLTAGTQYTFEVRAVNGIGNGAPATVTQTTATPTWELTLTDNGNAVTQLTEGGASATATVRITNGVTFGTAQTVTLEWDGLALDAGSPIQGSGGASEITIPPGTSSGTLVISAPDPGGVAAYTPPRTAPLWGRHGENRISGIDLTFSDDEEPPMATLTAAPAQVSEGEAIEVEIRLSLPYGGNATSTLQLIVTDAAGALVAPLPTGAEFDPGELTHAITLTAADNAVHNDGARVVTVALAPSPDASLYTLGAPSSATVAVADNDNVAPVFSDGASATRSVAENTAAGENVGAALTATDTDVGDTLTYTLEGADAASFDIVSTSGQIRTRPGVTYDHEARPSYSVTVKADDGNAGTATVAVTITVTDVAEPPAAPGAPTVTATSASTTSVDVAWSAPANPGKPDISGYDLRYRVGTSGSWTDGPQNRTGASASIASLTAGTSYQVQVRATNAEGDGPWSPSGSASTGTPSNAAPTFANPTATRSVPENSAADTNVGAVVTATDTDAGDTLTYTLEGAGAASFDIVSTSGQIRTRSGVTYDHEARSSYSVTVKADDGNAGTATIAVTITVTDVAEPPAAPAAPTVTATSASTTSVDVTWTAPANPGKPAISGYDLRYRAGIGGSWTDGPQNRTGASASIASLTAGTSYQVQVRATNAEGDGPWSASGTGSTGTSSNAAPTFANPTEGRSVPENSAADTNVGAVVTATDTDAGDTLTYTLEGADAASFDIVSTSGQIRTRSGVTYDHETKSSYSVTVKADDGNAGTATVAVTITVTDVAEPPAAPGAPTVTATSASTTSVDVAWSAPANPGKPDISGYDLRYRVGTSGSWTDGPQNRTGASASIASLTAGTSYQVQVRATNAEGDGPWSASGSASTGTASNAAPTFANPTATRSVPENSAADTNVGAVVTATDTDVGDTLTYTLEGAGAASFDIVSTSGQIRTRPGVTYDHEARSSYSVTVKADDGNAGTATIAVTITVTDVAEPPAAPGAPAVTTTSASTTSVDVTWTAPANPGKPAISGYDLRYRAGISGSWTDGPQNRTGASASIASLTAGTPYQVQVRATNAEGDGPWSASGSGSTGTSSNTAPTFANPTAGRSVPENSPAGTNVGAVVTATDTDVGDTLTYTLEGTDAASFDIVSTSGQIRTRPGVTYDHEAKSSYPVTVKADDGNAGTATVAVTITVTDVAEPPAAPGAPTVTATSASTTSVDVAWSAPANPGKPAISGYDLRYRAGTGGSWTDGPQNRTGASASIASLTAGTPYQVQVRATNAEGDGPWSASGTGSTGTSSNAAPDAPRSLTAEGGNQEVTLRWLAPASNGGSAILRYQYRQRYGSQAHGNWTDIADSAPGAANANSYTVTGLANGTLYTFEVRAVNTGGPGAESNEVVETPVPVKKLRASQKAWIARFDRTVATQVVDAIGARFSGGGNQGVTVGGQSLNRAGGAVDEALARDRLLAELGEPGAEPKVLSMTGRELLLGSSFSFGGGGKDGAPSWGAWGRFATGGFEADADGMRVEGDVTTGLLGADASRGRWLAGVAVSLSRGEGPFRLMSAMDSNRLSGTVESSLTALYPYAKLGLSDRMEAWGMVGLGTGELTVRESGGTPIETDLGMTMGAVGARGRLLSAGAGGGLDLALRSDAMWVRMKSDAVSGGEGNLAAAQALVSRLRLIVEGSRTFAMADERTITPRGEVGVRHDLGDAETGTGLEVGAGVKFAGAGFSIEGAVRALLAHEDAHYREWGASGAIRVDPGTAGRGLSLSIAPTWGNAASEAARLWSARDAGGLVRADDFEAKSRLEVELGYGVGAPHGPGLVTPYAGLTLSGGAPRALRTGVRWNASPSATVSLEASREAQGSGEAPANALTLRAEARW